MTKETRWGWPSLMLVALFVAGTAARAADYAVRIVEVAWGIAFSAEPRDFRELTVPMPAPRIAGQLSAFRNFVTRQLQRSTERRASPPFAALAPARC